ncbi:MAG: hypothetical protein SVR08_01875 [Spirochaetota bacterium]|nr:hypothetical protein [Spirochaetota bacterium]
MLYISLLLITTGIFLTIFSIIKNSEERFSPSIDSDLSDIDYLSEKPESPEISYSRDKANLYKKSDGDISNREEPAASNDKYENKLHQIDSPSMVQESNLEISSTTSGSPVKEYNAVLYEDSSNLIDYNEKNIIIDTEKSQYKNINRIGKGKVSIKGNGINFNIDKKFFHFDFHRIEDIKNGENYKALFLKGSDIVRLFIFENDLQFPDEFELHPKA